MSQGYVLPLPKGYLFTVNGALAPGYKLYFYVSGTTTPQDTFTDGTLSTPNPNPVVADGNGNVQIFVPPDNVYRVTLHDASDNPVWGPIDGVVATTSPTAGAPGTTVPTGAGFVWYGGAAPSGYLLCDGSAVNRGTFAALFTAIGTTYGTGDGITTFNLPDLRQRFPLGKAASGTGSVQGSTGGAIDHTHTGPSHTHGVLVTRDGWGNTFNVPEVSNRMRTGNSAGTGSDANGYQAANDQTFTTDTGGSTGLTGTANPPYQVVNYIIKT